MAMGCRLSRDTGTPVTARTIDVGPGGMRVHSDRPLRIDEVLDFDLDGEIHVSGRARVMREQTYRVYAIRFEGLGAPEERRLRGLL
jgi:hypothetical protein